MWDSIQGLIDQAIALLGEDQFFNMVAAAGIAFYAWIQRKIGLERKEGTLKHEALSFLEAGVAKTYQMYVKARKKANEDGHLTEEEKLEARKLAFTFAKDYAAKEGINLVKTLGGDMIPVLIEKAVGGLKKEAGGAVGAISTGNGTNGTTNSLVQPTVRPIVQPSVQPTVKENGNTTQDPV